MTLGKRNTITGATERGLVLEIEGREEAVPWSMVTGISAGRAKLTRNSDRWILVLAVEVTLNGTERVFIVGETEPAWLLLTAVMHIALPEILPFEIWGAELVAATAPIELYQRAESPS